MPGDEIVEKKHKNVKHLMAMAQNTDLSKSKTRKFPGLGPNIFKVDFEKQFAYGPVQTAEFNSRMGSAAADKDGEDIEPNEVNTEVEIQNTVHHKAIVKARNEHYVEFKQRFAASLSELMSKYDEERKVELRFAQYWQDNLREITAKHI